MILLVWSLVSSALEAARRREIANFLRAYLEKQRATQQLEMLTWRTIRPIVNNSLSVYSSGKLSKFKSESNLDVNLVFHNSLLQVFAEKFETLRAKEWRFFPKIWPSEEDAVYFIATEDVFSPIRDDQSSTGEMSPEYFNLNEKCDRLAVNKTKTEAMYSCSLEKFVEVVDAYSEGLLTNEHFKVIAINSMFTPPKKDRGVMNGTLSKSLVPLNKSVHGALPILQQLFYGDNLLLNNSTFRSEAVLYNSPQDGSSSGRMSARRRNRSCTYEPPNKEPELRIAPNFVRNLNDEDAFSYNSLPRYIRQMNNNSSLLSSQNSINLSSDHSDHSDDFRSIPRNFDFSKIQSANGRNTATSANFTPSSTLDSLKMEQRSVTSDSQPEDKLPDSRAAMRMIDDTDTETIDSERMVSARPHQPERVSFAQVLSNGKPNHVPHIELNDLNSKPPINEDFVRRSRRSTSVVGPTASSATTRRYSTILNGEFDIRHRSNSPSFEYFQSRSLKRLEGSGRERARPSISNSLYTPRRNFLSQRNLSTRAMAKPPSVLVYTGEDERLYSRIRKRLATFLPTDEITVFHVSIEALRKQPWTEPTTVCVILASTKELDDEAWTKIQTYFNHSGKLIFVCQNKLLSSMSHCDSTKQQTDLLRFAFGKGNWESSNKEFAKFLKKSLKSLPKSEEINETFRSKDVSMSSNFSVVLKKEKDAPLLLYMHNHGAQHASALFSDATTDQLIAPNNSLLKDCLESVGVKVSTVEIPSLTKGVLVAEYESQLESISGLRFGEEMGSNPKVFIRKTDVIKEEGLPEPSETLLPIELASWNGLTSGSFNFEKYYRKLSCKIGQYLLHIPIATTTMDVCGSICDAIPSIDNVVVVADNQVQGRGRGGNEWISTAGTAMFTFSYFVPKSAKIAKFLPIIQHVFCVSLVDAVRRLSNMDDFPLRIKWPNDFYYQRSHKVGGVLVSCKSRDDGFRMVIGAGINVSNQKPTICLNDMLPAGSSGTIQIEEVIAETLNRFRYWTMSFETDGGSEFRKMHRQMWLHSSEEVFLEDLQERVTIRGIDDYGYLEVRSKVNPDKIFSIGDDGNTFDMMKGLIRHKY